MITPSKQLRMPSYVDSRALAAATAETFTAPAGYTCCIITSDAAATYIRRGGTAVAAVADVVNGTASIYLPKDFSRFFDLGAEPANGQIAAPLASFSAIITGGGNITVEWYP